MSIPRIKSQTSCLYTINASLTTTHPEASDGIEIQDATMEFIDEDQNDNLGGNDTEGQDTDEEEGMDDEYYDRCGQCCHLDQSDASELESYNSGGNEEDEPDLSKIEPVRAFIPLEIWLEIFSFSEPKWLARVRRVSRTFKSLIDNEDVWKRVQQYRHPDYPGPLFGFTEIGMWSFRWGLDCTHCGTKKGEIFKYWQFRARLCRGCSKIVLIRVCTH